MRLLSTVAIFVCALLAACPAAQAQWTGKAELGVLVVERQYRIQVRQHQARPDAREREVAQHHLRRRAVRRERRIHHRRALRGALPGSTTRSPIACRWFGACAGRRTASAASPTRRRSRPAPPTSSSTARPPSSTARSAPVIARCKPRCSSRPTRVKSSIASKGESTSEPVVTLGSNFEHNFTETTKITNKLLAESGLRQHRGAGRHRAAGEHDRDAGAGRRLRRALQHGSAAAVRNHGYLLTTVNLVYNIK